MAQVITVTAVERFSVNGMDCWKVHQERPTGPGIHVFPADTLTWRAAEYGIDPADTATLLDIVLHEPHMPDPAVDDPPAAAALRQGARSGPVTLATALTRDDARHAHLARLEHTKQNVVRVQSRRADGQDPLDVIRRHTVHPDRVRAIHAAVHWADRPADLPTDPSAVRRHHETHGTTS